MQVKHNPVSPSVSYKQSLRRKYFILWTILGCTLSLLVFGITKGAKHMHISEIIAAIFTTEVAETNHQIVMNLRLPRLMAACISGGALGIAGAVMQIILRNPLGSPFTLGISNASAFGAALAYILLGNVLFSESGYNIISLQHLFVTVSAFAWAAGSAFFILFIARIKGATPENMILAGIVINTFFMALTSVLQFLADEIQLGSIVFWTFGDLSKTSWNVLLMQVLIIVPVILYLIKHSIKFNALDSGDQIAVSLGVDVHKFRMTGIMLTSLLTACIVSFYGIIAFVGLIIPHVVRLIAGNEARFLIISSMATGAFFLLICDLLSRSLFSPLVIPVGIITSVIGAPMFVLLLLKGSKRWSV